MLPTQQITPDWLLVVARRRAWLIVIPFVIAAIGAGVYAQLQPDRYRSTATVLVTPPQVQVGVRTGPNLQLRDRLRVLEQEILTRARLERIVLDFDLYREERAKGIMEDVITAMRRDINVSGPLGASRRNEGTSFTLSFTAENGRLAQRVAERLTALFIDENLRQRETIAEGTDQFLSGEVEAARQRLIETEKKLEDYKRQFGGQLPSHLSSNLSALQGTQSQIQSLNESISRDRAELLLVERQLNDLTGALSGVPDASPTDGPLDMPMAVSTPYDQPLSEARAKLDGLLLRLTPDHPDVGRQRRIVSELEERANAAQLQRPLSPGSPATASGRRSPTDVRRENQVAELRARVRQITLAMQAKENQIAARQAQASAYQARVDAAPAREAELISLTRDYDTLRGRYNALVSRSEDAKVAANMERRQVTEQFRIVEPPRVPERPLALSRVRTTMMGAAAGLGLGILVVGLLEYRDRSFRTEADILSSLALPVMAVIPAMTTARERRRQIRRRWMISATGVATVVAGTAVLVWKFGL
jgi:polysaccharide chain length determinant protein (PEP-CTERM system associated)